MRIAIIQHQSAVSPVYELADEISVHELDFKSGTSNDVERQPFKLSSSFSWLVEHKIQGLLVGTIDPDNVEILSKSGIHVFTGADDISPAENVERFIVLMRKSLVRKKVGLEEASHECRGGHGDDCCGGAGHDDPNHECRCN